MAQRPIGLGQNLPKLINPFWLSVKRQSSAEESRELDKMEAEMIAEMERAEFHQFTALPIGVDPPPPTEEVVVEDFYDEDEDDNNRNDEDNEEQEFEDIEIMVEEREIDQSSSSREDNNIGVDIVDNPHFEEMLAGYRPYGRVTEVTPENVNPGPPSTTATRVLDNISGNDSGHASGSGLRRGAAAGFNFPGRDPFSFSRRTETETVFTFDSSDSESPPRDLVLPLAPLSLPTAFPSFASPRSATSSVSPRSMTSSPLSPSRAVHSPSVTSSVSPSRSVVSMSSPARSTTSSPFPLQSSEVTEGHGDGTAEFVEEGDEHIEDVDSDSVDENDESL